MLTPSEFVRWLGAPSRRPLVMGILNVTPDSFSDGGKFIDPTVAHEHAESMISAGADLLDLGAESTRPGAERVPPEEQISRISPVLEKLSEIQGISLSIDTTSAKVAEYALDHGASIINDISAGLEDPEMFALARTRNCPLILMHKKGNPKTMQHSPVYRDLHGEILEFFKKRLEEADNHGIYEQTVLDPGIGFGKTTANNLAIIKSLPMFKTLGRPILIGVSRKRFIGEILNQPNPQDRMVGSLIVGAFSILSGADILRAHDVRQTVQAVKMIQSIQFPPLF